MTLMIDSHHRRSARRGIMVAMAVRAGVLCCVVGAAWSSASAQTPFRIAVLPDTQYYSQNNVANPTQSLFHDQVSWLLANRSAQNLVFVTHLGDVVNVAGGVGAASTQWPVALDAMSRLKSSTLPFSVLPGNHDWTSTAGTGSIEHYRSRFGDQANYYAGKSWSLGYDGRGINTAQKFDTPAGPMLNISLEFNATSPTAIAGAPQTPIAWAQSIINANPGVSTIISTHNAVNPGSGRDGFGQSLFKQLVRDNNQVFMVLNGHYSGNDNEEDRTTLNRYGRPVFERGVDYQNNANGGDGWLNLIEFDPAARKMRLATYSPKAGADLSGDTGGPAGAAFGNVGTVRTDYDSQFERDLDFARRFAPIQTQARTQQVLLQQGVNGYTGTTDIKLDRANPSAVNATAPTIAIENDDTAAIVTQGLIKFDGIFGSGASQVAPDQDIARATLRLYVDAAVSNSQGSGLLLHRASTDWSTSSTWNSLADGIVANGIEAQYVEEDSAGASNGSENVKQGTWIELDVTDSLRSFRHGAANQGWALLPWASGSNALIFNTSEAANPARRPQLAVEVTADQVVTQSFKNGVNGYAAARDTWVGESAPTTQHGSDAILRVDAGSGTDYLAPDEQSLLKFDGLIGNSAGQIPEDDVRVTSAMLVLNVSDDANAEGSGLIIHRMNQAWTDAATWASLGDGVNPGQDASSTPDDTLGEDANVVAIKPGKVYADVTASLLAWTQQAEPNHGWALLPTMKGTNAVFFDSVNAALADRPELVVRYQSLAPASWTDVDGGTWSDASAWLNGEVPHAAGRTVWFGDVGTTQVDVVLNDRRMLGTVRFDSPGAYTIAGTGAIELKRLNGKGRLLVDRGHHLIDVAVVLDEASSIEVDAGASLTLSQTPQSSLTASLTKRGGGAVTLPALQLYALNIEAGSVALTQGVSRVSALSILPEGRIELAGGAMLLDGQAAASASTIALRVRSQNILSAQPYPQTAVALVRAADMPSLAQRYGIEAGPTSLWAISALPGDINLDNAVNFNDLLTLAQHYNQNLTGPGWLDGDVNLDATINFSDLLILAQHYGVVGMQAFESDWAVAQALVPEPLLSVLIGAAFVPIRRRR
jgi:Calcineurin-like phosphoesterase